MSDRESEFHALTAAGRSALDLAAEALALFDERRPAIWDQGDAEGFVVEGRRLEIAREDPRYARGQIGAQAFVANLVIVENCARQIAQLEGAPPHIRAKAARAVERIRAVVDRRVRNTAEHIDDRVMKAGGRTLISNSILEGGALCATRADGSTGVVEVTAATLEAVFSAFYEILWSPEQLARMRTGVRPGG